MSPVLTILPVEKLTAQHQVSGFDCGKYLLNIFIRKYALRNQLLDSSQTYVVHQGDGVVLGYYSLVYGHVSLEDCPEHVRVGMPNFPVPVMVLARWAVDEKFQGQGIGKALLKDALLRIVAAAKIGGLKAILVDAIDDEMVQKYKELGFTECPVGDRRLMITIADVRAGLDPAE